ncbi:MAG: lactate utilization protein [Thermoplasmata archaeon]|nr:MAG: lactate utilization protein [Thermoplasmata archaeon]
MQPLRFVEPTMDAKRLNLIRAKMRREEPFDVQDVTLQLKKMRMAAVENLDGLVERTLDSLNSFDGVTASYVESGDTAARAILDLAGGINTYAVSNSSTVFEVVQHLEKSNDINIIESYIEDLKMWEGQLWDVEHKPFFEFPVYEQRSIWNSYADTTSKALRFPGEKITDSDFVGLLGANAVSSTGRIFFLQHLHNISNIVLQAKKLVVIAGINKLVESEDDALFQVKCCGLFGYESILSELLTLMKGSVEDEPKKEGASEFVFGTSFPEIHVILLDNGRKEIFAGEFKELLQCISCRACTKLCPRANTGSPGYRSAKDILFSAFSEGIEHAVKFGLYNCTLCRGCDSQCPVGIPLTNFLGMLREEAKEKGLIPEIHKKLSANVSSYGTPYGASATDG